MKTISDTTLVRNTKTEVKLRLVTCTILGLTRLAVILTAHAFVVPREGTATLLAQEDRSAASVDLDVARQISSTHEACRAGVALERAFTRMHVCLVTPEHRHRRKTVVARVALERPLPGMDSHVAPKMLPLSEGLCADGARERSFSGVGSHVQLQVPAFKLPAADGTRALLPKRGALLLWPVQRWV